MSAFLEHIEAVVSLWKDTQTKVNDLNRLLSNATKMHQDLETKYNELQKQTVSYTMEIDTHKHSIKQLNETIRGMEEDHKEFSKVSHIVRMERDNCRLNDYVRILERRIAFYQNNATVVQDTPVQETPVQDTPVQDTPVQETPVQETPVQETPVQDTPVQDTPVQDTPVQETPVQETPVQDTPVQETPVQETPVQENCVATESSSLEDTEEETNILTEKKIKGIVYYVSKQNKIHIKETDNSVGVQVGTIETLPTGKTKVKWIKKPL